MEFLLGMTCIWLALILWILNDIRKALEDSLTERRYDSLRLTEIRDLLKEKGTVQ